MPFSIIPSHLCVCVCVAIGKASGFNISVPMLLDSTGKPSKKVFLAYHNVVIGVAIKKLGRHRICMGVP